MTAQPRGIRLCGTGAAVPAQVLQSHDIDRQFGLADGTVFSRYGVRKRHCTLNESAAEIAVQACEQALRRADMDWGDIDCLVAASATMDQALPYNAALILAALDRDTGGITAFDIGASCLSFLVGLDTLSYLIDSGRYRNVMIVSADIATFSLDWSSLGESAIFGDGAAAAIFRKSTKDEPSRILSSRIETYAEGAAHCRIKAGGSRYHPLRISESIDPLALFHMDGPRLFRTVAREIPRFVAGLLEDAGLATEQLALVIPHQASRLAIDHLAKRLRIEPARTIDILADFGNQVAASLPSALHHAIAHERIERGASMMLIGSGAGVTIGGIVMVY